MLDSQRTATGKLGPGGEDVTFVARKDFRDGGCQANRQSKRAVAVLLGLCTRVWLDGERRRSGMTIFTVTIFTEKTGLEG